MYHSDFALFYGKQSGGQGQRETVRDKKGHISPSKENGKERKTLQDLLVPPQDAAKWRAIQQLSLSNNDPNTTYNDMTSGPLRPGFHFTKLLSQSPSLQLQIPDTIYVKKSKIYMLSTNDKGIVTKTVPENYSEDEVSRFIEKFFCRSLISSRCPLGRSTIKAPDSENTIDNSPTRNVVTPEVRLADLYPNYSTEDFITTRVVAIQKRPQWREQVSNTSQLHSPLSLNATLSTLFQGEEPEMILQQYIKPKGKTANFFR